MEMNGFHCFETKLADRVESVENSTVDDLRDFETLHPEGGDFQNEDYENSQVFDHTWKHLGTSWHSHNCAERCH